MANKVPLTKPLEFILAGKAIFTVLNTNTGNHLTYKVTKCKDRNLWWVAVFHGTNNDDSRSYRYIGTLFNDKGFAHTKGSKVSKDAPSFKVFSWLMLHLHPLNQIKRPHIEVYHEGRCGRCGARLTVPESIKRGIGPICKNLLT